MTTQNEHLAEEGAHKFSIKGVCHRCHRERAALKSEGDMLACASELDLAREGAGYIRQYFTWANNEIQQANMGG